MARTSSRTGSSESVMRFDSAGRTGRKQTLTVTALADRHMPKAQARLLYHDTTPPISEEEKEMRRLERIYRAGMQRSHAPDKRERRAIRKLKGR